MLQTLNVTGIKMLTKLYRIIKFKMFFPILVTGVLMNNVTVVDFETTGLYATSGDKITEIGAIKLRGNRICGIFNTLVYPERQIPEFSTKITGITDEMVSGFPTIAQVLPLFVQFVGDDTLVMHNSDFDGGFFKA